MEKMRLCWRWSGPDGGERLDWLDACGPEAAQSYEVSCGRGELDDWEDQGAQAWADSEAGPEAEQAMLLAMAASGHAQAVVWIDSAPGPSNLTGYAIELCRSLSIPLAVEPAGAAAMLWGLARMRQEAIGARAEFSQANEHVFEFELEGACKPEPRRGDACAEGPGELGEFGACEADADEVDWLDPQGEGVDGAVDAREPGSQAAPVPAASLPQALPSPGIGAERAARPAPKARQGRPGSRRLAPARAAKRAKAFAKATRKPPSPGTADG